jgi:DNA-binding transcriptional MerR regulator
MIRFTSRFLLLCGFLPIVCIAQDNQAASPSAASQQPAQATTEPTPTAAAKADKTKKVWTNEDVKSAGSVSVVGDKGNQKYTMTKPADPATIAKYRNSLQKLQVQLDNVNKQLKLYDDFTEGKPVTESGRDMSHGYSRTPVDQQAARLREKKKQLEDQMDGLYEEARKKGIESGQLK